MIRENDATRVETTANEELFMHIPSLLSDCHPRAHRRKLKRRYLEMQERRGILVCDLDGTLAERQRPVSRSVASVLLGLIDSGWRLAILTGQPFPNVHSRLLHSLMPKITEKATRRDAFRIFTCEGANEWRLGSTGRPGAEPGQQRRTRVSKREKGGVERVIREDLDRLLASTRSRLIEAAQWQEEALCVFKVEALPTARLRLAQRLETLLHRRGLPNLRAGVAGQTSVVIARRQTTKQTVLERIVASLAPRERAFYLADEFVGAGNDVTTQNVKGLVRVDFGNGQSSLPPTVLPGGGVGPTAVERWLRRLLRTTDATLASAHAIGERAVR